MYSDYFLTLVRETTGHFTLLVIPRSKGLTTRHMTMSGSTAAGTAFVDLDEVRVPLDMVVGERGKGFKYIVSNFNHEVSLFLFSPCLTPADHRSDCSSGSRPCVVQEFASRTPCRRSHHSLHSFRETHRSSYAQSRETFGKTLTQHGEPTLPSPPLLPV